MADVVRSASVTRRQAIARRRTSDVWIAVTALVAAFLALPLAQTNWHGAEASAILAVAATAMLAGQRWAISIVVLAELLLLPTLWPRAFAADASFPSNVIALVTLGAIVPGVVAMRRAAAALVLVTGRARTARTCRQFQWLLAAVGVLAALLPVVS